MKIEEFTANVESASERLLDADWYEHNACKRGRVAGPVPHKSMTKDQIHQRLESPIDQLSFQPNGVNE